MYWDWGPRRFGIERPGTSSIWVWLGKHVLRIGIPPSRWTHNLRYAWQPPLSFFRVFK